MNAITVVIDDATRELLEDAAKRVDTDFEKIARQALIDFAGIEYSKQQCEDAKTC